MFSVFELKYYLEASSFDNGAMSLNSDVVFCSEGVKTNTLTNKRVKIWKMYKVENHSFFSTNTDKVLIIGE